MGTNYFPADAEGWRRWGLRGLLFLALVVFTWPVADIAPLPGIDQSWALGLSLGVADGLAWGRDVIFTYGPFGYSLFPRAIDSGTLFEGLFLAGIVQLLLVGVLYACIRRSYGPVLSTVLAFLAVCAIGPSQYDATIAIGFGLVALALTVRDDRVREATWALAVGGGALAALALLIKLNAGIAVAVLVVIALLGMPSPKRSLPLALGSGLLSLVVLWLLAGQPLAALGDYGHNALETIGGYVEAMGLDQAGQGSEWHLLVILVSAATLTILAWTSFPGLSDRRRGALALAVLAMHYFILREVFLRHNLERGATFAILLAVAVAIPWPRDRRALGLAIAAALAVAFVASVSKPISEIWGPTVHAHDLAHQLHVVVDDGELEREQDFGRASLESLDEIPPDVIAALRGRCVNSEPTEISAVWAYDFEWCPLPTLQSYSAYTERLDQLAADTYADAEDGPDGVLRLDFGLDGRLPAWESPAAMVAMLCNFESAAEDGVWQALVRVPDRCGRPRSLGAVEGELGEPIALPPAPPGTVLIARVHGLEVGAFEHLESLFVRPEERFISINGEPPYRVVPDTVQDGLILDVPAGADYPEPFAMGLDAKTLTAEIEDVSGRSVSVDLEAIPIEISRRPRPGSGTS